jgi:hypothetical protein
MSVSLYYGAHRNTPLDEAESTVVAGLVTARAASFPYDDEEGLYLHDGGAAEPREVVAGSTKLPADPDRAVPVIVHVLDSLTELRRAVPDAEWHVHLDDLDVPWDEAEGYALPGMRDAAR